MWRRWQGGGRCTTPTTSPTSVAQAASSPAASARRRRSRGGPRARAFAVACLAAAGGRTVHAAKEVLPRTELTDQCSRVIGRHTRKLIEKEVLKPAQRAGIDTWPAGCPLDPALDKYASHEKMKQRKRPGGSSTTWTCGICGKAFKSEHYLDLHFERRHMDETVSRTTCVADYCEVFESCQGDKPQRRRKNESQCDELELAKGRRRCEEALTKCFPLDSEKHRGLHAQLSRHFCQVLDCRIREERRRENEALMMPVVVLLILIVLVCLLVFGLVICCVDYSDDIIQFLLDSRLASSGAVKRLVQTREKSRQAVGMDRTKRI